MTEGKEGKPFCLKAATFLSREAIRHTQCEECDSIRWIGCPSFKPKYLMLQAGITAKYIKNFHLNIQTEQKPKEVSST